MFTDTHCHLVYCIKQDQNEKSEFKNFAHELLQRQMPFVLDIGTRCDDFAQRISLVRKLAEELPPEKRQKVLNIFRFSAGIWPSAEAIADRKNQLSALTKIINETEQDLCAIGECGLDHHWNKPNLWQAEAEFFEMQIDLARRLNLPVIVHSRDAFEGTLACIKNIGYNRGLIHCYSYGLNEARCFLDAGWYISFSGSITYAKGIQRDEIEKLIRFVPDDLFLMETDAPFLAPVPFRGRANSPLFVEHVYRYAAPLRGTTLKALSDLVLQNAFSLFS